MDKYEQCALLIRQAKNILILTGAGMSTESGIPDFRSSNGLYKGEFHGMRPEEILSYTFFRQNPDIFWEYIKTNMDYTGIHPNAGHRILAKWENELELSIVTQNIEQLHTQAGSKKVTKVHGSLMTCTCQGCQRGYSLHEVINKKQGYLCGCGSVIKPDIVLYEESVDKMTEVFKQAKTADCLLVLGTSLTVYPVASLPDLFLENRKPVIIMNQTETPYAARKGCIELHEGIGDTLKKIDSLLTESTAD